MLFRVHNCLECIIYRLIISYFIKFWDCIFSNTIYSCSKLFNYRVIRFKSCCDSIVIIVSIASINRRIFYRERIWRIKWFLILNSFRRIQFMVIFHFSNRWYIYIQSYHNLRLSIFEAIKIVQRCFIACTSYHFFPISKKNIRSTFEILIAPLIQYIIFPFFPFFPLSSLLTTSYLICAKRRLPV